MLAPHKWLPMYHLTLHIARSHTYTVFRYITSHHIACSYTIWLLQPLHRLLSSEAGRLVHLMAELPKEISVEEVVVALVDEMTSHRQDESVLDLTDTAGADVGRGQVRGGDHAWWMRGGRCGDACMHGGCAYLRG